MTAASSRSFPSGQTLGFLLLRLWLALRAIVTGLEKFSGIKIEKQPLLDEFGQPDINGAMIEVKQKVYGLEHYHGLPDALATAFKREPLMPGWALSAYSAGLGWALLGLGIALLLGVCTRITLFAMGLLYVSLTLGLILINQNDGVAWLAIHVLLVAVALNWADANRVRLVARY